MDHDRANCTPRYSLYGIGNMDHDLKPICPPILLYSAILINQQFLWSPIPSDEIGHISRDQAIVDSIDLGQLSYKIRSVGLKPRE